jgi:hypothetical protein
VDTHEERVLNARLGSLNSALSRFVLKVIDADQLFTFAVARKERCRE